jgi:DNA-binding transcriptional ArsR family regulator
MPRPTASEDVFRAVADPTRRGVIELLGREREMSVTALATELGVSLPLLSRHLGVLRAANVVAEHRVGRQRMYRLRPEPLRELYDWAALFTGFWAERVESLRDFLERQPDEEGNQP